MARSGVAVMTLDAVVKAVGVSKSALYYYFPSNDALLFEMMFSALDAHARAVRDAVDDTRDGTSALAALVRESVQAFAPRLEDFRLVYLQSQLSTPGSVRFAPDEFARIRPLHDLFLAGAAERLARDEGGRGNRAKVDPRLLASPISPPSGS